MFTGIIQDKGRLIRKLKRGGQLRLTFQMKGKAARGLRIGESVAANGVCLTVARFSKSGKNFSLDADVVNETLKSTTLASLKLGNAVNLERSLKTGDPVGGHFVTGHVDHQGRIRKIKRSGKNIIFSIEAPASFFRFVAKKGSVAVDGVSLTVQEISPRVILSGVTGSRVNSAPPAARGLGEPRRDSWREDGSVRFPAEKDLRGSFGRLSGSLRMTFSVALIPHTLKVTNLGERKAGDAVNLEADLVARYLVDLMAAIPRKSKLKISKLKGQGF